VGRQKILLGAAVAVAIAIIAVLCGTQYEVRLQLRAQSDTLHEQFKRLAQLEVENVRLSNIVAQANTPLGEVQMEELQKLREQIQLLHRQTNQVANLRAEISRLRTALSNARNGIAPDVPPDVPPEDIYPRENWKFAGYDTPEATLQSIVWAISVGDQDSYMAGLGSDLRDQMQSDFADGSFADEGPMELGDATAYRILDRDVAGDNQLVYTLYMDGQDDDVSIILQNIDGRWVVVGQGERNDSLGMAQ
jgi:hypothetical protein